MAGDRLRSPRGGRGMQEMLYPTSFLKGKGLGKACALVTDGRFFGRHQRAQHRPRIAEAAEGGAIRADRRRRPHPHRHSGAQNRSTGQRRRAVRPPPKNLAKGKDAFRPNRDRYVSLALQAYALMATSAAMGAVRDISQLERKHA